MINLDDCALVLESGQDVAEAITKLLQKHESHPNIHMPATGWTIPKLVWRVDTDWLREATEIAEAYGYALRKLNDCWTLEPAQMDWK